MVLTSVSRRLRWNIRPNDGTKPWGTLGCFYGSGGSFCDTPKAQKRRATRRLPTASQLPLLGSNQDSPDRVPLRLSPPLNVSSVRGLDCAFTFAVTRSGGSHPVSTPSPLGAWLGVTSEGFADFESMHARRFWRGVQRLDRQVPLESGVLPVTPRGRALDPRVPRFRTRALILRWTSSLCNGV